MSCEGRAAALGGTEGRSTEKVTPEKLWERPAVCLLWGRPRLHHHHHHHHHPSGERGQTNPPSAPTEPWELQTFTKTTTTSSSTSSSSSCAPCTSSTPRWRTWRGEGGAQTHGEKTSLPGSSLHQQPAAVEVNPREADRGCTHLETDGSAVESRSERRTDGLLRARSTKSAEAQSWNPPILLLLLFLLPPPSASARPGLQRTVRSVQTPGHPAGALTLLYDDYYNVIRSSLINITKQTKVITLTDPHRLHSLCSCTIKSNRTALYTVR